jgi:hypothetical protein
VADHPLRPATDRRLGKPLPHLLANPTSAAPGARGRYQSPAFTLRSHAVLIRLSPGYPPRLDTFRCITHPFATRQQAEAPVTVRLACVKHAASVHSEPGSNSSVQLPVAYFHRPLTQTKLPSECAHQFPSRPNTSLNTQRSGHQCPHPSAVSVVKEQCPRSNSSCRGGRILVAGAGFEPTTFGL